MSGKRLLNGYEAEQDKIDNHRNEHKHAWFHLET
jgi:hypothetical protein